MREGNRFVSCTETEMTYLGEADPILGGIITHLGPIKRRGDDDLFSSVVRHIVGQQISMAAQATIWGRMGEALGTIDEAAVNAAGIDTLQGFGMTFRKAAYIHAFSRQVLDGSVDLEALSRLDDERAITALMQVKGIGRWTAEMILLFGLLRPDVVSFGDLAIIRGMKILYGLDEVDTERFDSHRRRYSPYGSTASLYLWAVSKLDPSQPPLLARSAR
ncbi:MAG TPA: DNA-3-methyladenine glycosylase 2 family protein [Sphaerochaeta sp.]|jgi:DNA-3-methyladenine glycosylase II|nr:DNA-3-methyladenine glycosylase 2 family protein [Spirochaetota bacterium]NLV60712.1 DNA-3-methyladenine glycosylase 2 family protein [Spirochaetales bacterium]HOQ94939.1 DNA-3-methyladenine glycosylase 2 family protein [Sphaerochaeta sp.]HPK47291.1 DNA-3-methyladenine glycosylase 2 family protein [Sphaerochaeta sp.]HPY12310.1 DNA-3-methyladenine glycosylase 2 family protein [Sphaerochaeta sp.]